MVAEAAALLGIARIAQKPLGEIAAYLKEKSIIGWQKTRVNALSEKFELAVKKVALVKTIMNSTEAVNLNSFYHPPKIKVGENELVCKFISEVPYINSYKNLIIRGTAGQGKSMFMRYMTIKEAEKGDRLSVFFELRKLKKSESLKSAIKNSLEDIFGVLKEETFDGIASSGKIVLFLDGFDEVASEVCSDLVRELEQFSIKYPNMQMVVSSRPDSDIEMIGCFNVIHIVPCGELDQYEIVKKIVRDVDDQKSILAAISSSEHQVKELLKTPLMVVLFVLTYSAKQKLPQNVSDFYKELFSVLMIRHDALKPAFNRRKSTGLSEHQLQQVFELFSFLTKKDRRLSFSHPDFLIKSHEALTKNGYQNISPQSFLEDMTKVVCLIVLDGREYRFIHKSIQEFFAASYISRVSEENSNHFYTTVSQGSYNYKAELGFLRMIDQYRYYKYFFSPSLIKFFDFFGCSFNGFLAKIKGVLVFDFYLCKDFDVNVRDKGFCVVSLVGFDYCFADNLIYFSDLIGICIEAAIFLSSDKDFHGLLSFYTPDISSAYRRGIDLGDYVKKTMCFDELVVSNFDYDIISQLQRFFDDLNEENELSMSVIKMREDASIFDGI